jgi:hypothetical protein
MLPLPNPPATWVLKACQLATDSKTSLTEKIVVAAEELFGSLTFDSWELLAPTGVRGVEASVERRLRFEADGHILDLRAEKDNENWEFVAQVFKSGQSIDSFVIRVGDIEVHPTDGKFYQWSSTYPPEKITLIDKANLINFSNISWKQ